MCSLQAAWPAALRTPTLNYVRQWIREELGAVGPTGQVVKLRETAAALATAQMVTTLTADNSSWLTHHVVGSE
jgi:hypothetical protein